MNTEDNNERPTWRCSRGRRLRLRQQYQKGTHPLRRWTNTTTVCFVMLLLVVVKQVTMKRDVGELYYVRTTSVSLIFLFDPSISFDSILFMYVLRLLLLVVLCYQWDCECAIWIHHDTTQYNVLRYYILYHTILWIKSHFYNYMVQQRHPIHSEW